MNVLFVLLYDIALLAGTAYLVGWQGWSPWWFLAAACFFTTLETKKTKD
jgi:hypothetical protein